MTCTAHQPSIVASSELEACWAIAHLCQDHFDELVELCDRHWQAPSEVNSIGYDVIDLPLLRFKLLVYVDGEVLVDESAKPEIMPLYRHVEVPLQGALPEWWRPGSRPLESP